MSEEGIFEQFKKAVIEMDEDAAKAAAENAMAQGIDPVACIDKGIAEGMKVISEKFDEAEIFVPQIMLAADAFKLTPMGLILIMSERLIFPLAGVAS